MSTDSTSTTESTESAENTAGLRLDGKTVDPYEAVAGEPERVVPVGSDPLDDLTAQELGIIGVGLRLDGKTVDPYEAVAGGLRWVALARIAWVWAKRRDPHAKLDTYAQMRPAELGAVVGLYDPAEDPSAATEDEREPAEENPTDPAPAS